MDDANADIDPDTQTHEPSRMRRVIAVVDVVESVRQMRADEADEADTIERWRRFVRMARAELLPVHRRLLFKSLGDGLLLEFAAAGDALRCALALLQAMVPLNAGRAAGQAMALRVGVHVADVARWLIKTLLRWRDDLLLSEQVLRMPSSFSGNR